MKLPDLFDVDLLAEMERDGYVRRQRHPSLPLSILNYTAGAQYGRVWNDVTLTCRGLIVDDDGIVVARPFPKFFNLAEHDADDHRLTGRFTAHEKLDGSLGILWQYAGECGIATRGSFISEQAQWASAWLSDRLGQLPFPLPDVTWLFEIIYPANRIVLDYGDRAELVFLAAIENETGETVAEVPTRGFTCATRYDASGLTPAEALTIDPTGEGFVLHFYDHDLRVKVKHDEYVRLHRLLTGTSARTVWEHLANGGDVEALAADVPDEFHAWLRSTAAEIQAQYDAITASAEVAFDRISHLSDDRKAFAAEAVKSEHRALLFLMLDGRPIAEKVWRDVRPESARPFTVDGDESEQP